MSYRHTILATLYIHSKWAISRKMIELCIVQCCKNIRCPQFQFSPA